MAGLNFVGSPDFVQPQSPTARHSTQGARRSRRGSAATTIDPRLSIIEEDNQAAATSSPQAPIITPPKTHNRPFSRRFLGPPPNYSNGQEPPTYTFFDVKGPNGEKFEDLRNNKFIARRGGWKKLCIIFFLLFLLLIALVVGLAVGLTKKKSSSSAPAASNGTTSGNQPATTGPFPAGSYTFTTFLSTISTNCTSNPQSWTCEPSQTFAQSPSNAEAIFNWIITDSSPTVKNFSISSTNNPFAVMFANASLTLVDAGTSNERYSFKATSVPKITYPTATIKCYYNETTLSGDLYTKKPKTYPSGGSSSSAAAPAAPTSSAGGSSGQAYPDWGFAVDATQSIGGGMDVPECYNWKNGVDGSRVEQGYTAQPGGSFCSCAYANYN